jgi:3-keto-disaccharide hydrolase
MKKIFLTTALLICAFGTAFGNSSFDLSPAENGFLGMWTLDIEGGGVGWLEVHEKQGFLDANLLWIGGSVVPVAHVYLVDEENLVVTRTAERTKHKGEDGKERKHTLTFTLRVKKTGDTIEGTMGGPNWRGTGENSMTFTGKRLPDVPSAPDLSKVKYGKPIKLFNGKNLKGWKLINPEKSNGFKAVDGELANDPVQPKDGEHLSYGNLRTEQEFKDFNLSLEVNVPKGNNSGVYLKGMYEIQVFDSYGKDLDSHNMGALYSRITPSVAAEKPAGSWQSLDITLCKRHVTVTLNGKIIIDNQPAHGPTGGAIISDVFAAGPIYLQGDHGNVSYRNLILKPILD